MLAVAILTGAVVIIGLGSLVKYLNTKPVDETVSEKWLAEQRGKKDSVGK